LNVGFTEQDIALQKIYLEKLTAKNKLIEEVRQKLLGLTDDDEIKKVQQQLDDAINGSLTIQTEQEDAELKLKIEQVKERINAIKKLNEEAEVDNDKFKLSELEAQKELNELLLEEQRRYNKSKAKLQEESNNNTLTEQEILESAVQVLTSISDRAGNERLNRIDRELSSLQRREEFLISIAERGSQELTDNLAFEQQKIAELELERERVAKNQQRRELALAAIQTYIAEVNSAKSKNDKNPGATALARTAVNVALLQSIFASLPAFYDGVEDTGEGGNIDSKKGFLAVLHPHERVLTAEQNKKLTGLSNTELVSRVTNAEYSSNNNLERKIEELISVTKSKAEYLGGDYNNIKKTFTETIKNNGNLIRKHSRTDSIF